MSSSPRVMSHNPRWCHRRQHWLEAPSCLLCFFPCLFCHMWTKYFHIQRRRPAEYRPACAIRHYSWFCIPQQLFGHHSEQSSYLLSWHKCWWTCKQGKHTEALVKLWQCGLHTPLPSISLANVCSISNKTDELSLQTSNIRLFFLCCSVLHWDLAYWALPVQRVPNPGFHLHKADWDTSLLGKTKWRGICFYMNQCWGTNVTVLTKTCSPNLVFFY